MALNKSIASTFESVGIDFRHAYEKMFQCDASKTPVGDLITFVAYIADKAKYMLNETAVVETFKDEEALENFFIKMTRLVQKMEEEKALPSEVKEFLNHPVFAKATELAKK